MTETEMVHGWRSKGYGWQSIGNMMGVSADRAKAKWEIVYDPPITLDNLIRERSALNEAVADYRRSILDALDRIAEIDRIVTAVDE
jgi:hypothetical protein